MKYNSNALLESLQADVRRILFQASQLLHHPIENLVKKPAHDKWSIAQVLEHLNIYCRYYISSIEAKLHLNQSKPDVEFVPGWLGNYFTRLMSPKDGNAISKKMKAPKNAVPSAQPDAKEMLDEFIDHQCHLLNLLQIAKTANLNSILIPTSLSALVSLRLGDTFRFFIAHEQRHLMQIENLVKELNLMFSTPE